MPERSLFRGENMAINRNVVLSTCGATQFPAARLAFMNLKPGIEALGSSYAWIGEPDAGLIFDIKPFKEPKDCALKSKRRGRNTVHCERL